MITPLNHSKIDYSISRFPALHFAAGSGVRVAVILYNRTHRQVSQLKIGTERVQPALNVISKNPTISACVRMFLACSKSATSKVTLFRRKCYIDDFRCKWSVLDI